MTLSGKTTDIPKMEKKMREETLKKWEDLGFLEGLGFTDETKRNIALLTYNQQQHMLSEGTISAATKDFPTIKYPLIRQVFAKTKKKMSDDQITQLSEKIVEVVNKSDNDYDSIDDIYDLLKSRLSNIPEITTETPKTCWVVLSAGAMDWRIERS